MRNRIVCLVVFFCGPFIASTVGQQLVNLDVRYRWDVVAVTGARSSVAMQSVIEQLTPTPDGGPQALEGYTKIAHDRGLVRLALGTIGNVEMNGAGDVEEIRSMQAGGVVTNRGRVKHWTGMYFSRPRAGLGYTGAANIDVYDYATFDNGWSIRPAGDRLLFCDPQGDCRDVFAR
jgi:hypothetical protein